MIEKFEEFLKQDKKDQAKQDKKPLKKVEKSGERTKSRKRV
jgi:hypothetical protein